MALRPTSRGARPVGEAETRRDWAGGGLVSTAADLARFVHGLHEGPLLDPAHRTRMCRMRPVRDPGYTGYALGLGETEVAGRQLIGHTGAWGAFAYWWPHRRTILTGTVNRAGIDRRPLLEAVALRSESAW